jgi:phosphatidylserine/phosphatidylglycerophosphate/cardiolipin synthase-like enzyme
VSVKVKIDTAKSEQKKETQIVALLKSAGVQVQAVAPGGRNHNKFAVIDGAKILTGSYNWTLKAEKTGKTFSSLIAPNWPGCMRRSGKASAEPPL